MMFWSTVLFIASILISQSAMDFFGAVMFLCAAVVVWKKRRAGLAWRETIPTLGFEWVWPLWLLIIAVSYVASPLKNTHAWMHLFEFKWIILVYALAVCFRELRPKPSLYKSASVVLGICSLYAVVIWFMGYDPIHPDYDMAPWVGGHRTGGLLANAIVFGHVYGAAFCLAVGATILAIPDRKPELKFLLAALLITAAALLLNLTRGVWIACGVSLFFMGFLFRRRWGVIVALGGLTMAGAITALWPTVYQRITHIASTGDGREWIWAAHWRIFRDHPWTGVGYGENYQLVPEYYKQIHAPEGLLVSHAHNQYLHFLAGAGIGGLIAYLVVLALLFRAGLQVWRALPAHDFFRRGLILGALGTQVYFWVGGLTEANFEHSKMKSVLIVVAALVAWMRSEQTHHNEGF